MNKQQGKRRGPLLWLAGRSRRFWVVVALMPVLYVASYGPLTWVSYHLAVDANGGLQFGGFGVPEPIISALAIYTFPLQLAISDYSPRFLRDGIIWYLGFWV